jgi:glycosyltransferase involved in cell wall biosynthesis
MRMVITTTLNNNLFHAKLAPLARSRPDLEIVVVSDRQGPSYDHVRWVWPSGIWQNLGRLGGRLPLLAAEIFHPRTRLVMAYSLVPHGLFAVHLGRLRQVPVYLHFIAGPAEISFAHNTDVSDNRVIARSRNPQRLESYARRVSRRADRIFVPGSNTERFLIHEGYDPQRIIRLHSSVDLDRYFPGNEVRDIDVLVSAQLRERKRPLLTLEIFREILRRRPNTRFRWLGDGILHDEFNAALDRLELRPAVNWQVTDDVGPFYRRARVFLLSSINEGLSLASMEAMACGMVPVVSDCGDMAEVARNNQTGCLLPIDAGVDVYAQAVLKYLDDQDLWQRHSQAAQQIIHQEHSFASVESAWREILDTLDRSEHVHSLK